MKKMLALATALAVLAYAGMAFARAQAADTNKPAPAPAATTAPVTHAAKSATMAHSKGTAAPAMHGMMLSGKIVTVDAVANTLVIKGKKGDVTLNVDPSAKIKVGKENKLADLKAGTLVKVSYKMDGEQKVATRIW